jgi:hypothetical protein
MEDRMFSFMMMLFLFSFGVTFWCETATSTNPVSTIMWFVLTIAAFGEAYLIMATSGGKKDD